MNDFAAEITVAELDDDPYPVYERLRAESPGWEFRAPRELRVRLAWRRIR